MISDRKQTKVADSTRRKDRHTIYERKQLEIRCEPQEPLRSTLAGTVVFIERTKIVACRAI